MQIQNTLGQQFYATTKSLSAGTNNINLNVRFQQGDYYIGLTDASGKTAYRKNKNRIIFELPIYFAH